MREFITPKSIEVLYDEEKDIDWKEAKFEYERKFMTDAMFWH